MFAVTFEWRLLKTWQHHGWVKMKTKMVHMDLVSTHCWDPSCTHVTVLQTICVSCRPYQLNFLQPVASLSAVLDLSVTQSQQSLISLSALVCPLVYGVLATFCKAVMNQQVTMTEWLYQQLKCVAVSVGVILLMKYVTVLLLVKYWNDFG